MNDNTTNDDTIQTDDATMSLQGQPLAAISDNWIAVVDGQFTCSECENTSHPETNTVDGVVEANLDEIQNDLERFPSKVIYGICPVCGMEFTFRLADDDLYLEPSEMEK